MNHSFDNENQEVLLTSNTTTHEICGFKIIPTKRLTLFVSNYFWKFLFRSFFNGISADKKAFHASLVKSLLVQFAKIAVRGSWYSIE